MTAPLLVGSRFVCACTFNYGHRVDHLGQRVCANCSGYTWYAMTPEERATVLDHLDAIEAGEVDA